MSEQSLFRLLQLVSPALPVGAFAYSQGMEMAVEKQLIIDEASTKSWIKGLVASNLAYLEMPILVRLYQSLEQDDQDAFQHWNGFILAARETKELYQESTLMAKALMRLVKDLNIEMTCKLPEQMDWTTAFALAAYAWSIDIESVLKGYAWSWLENQIAAAIKLVPLGQTQGQRLLLQLSDYVIEAKLIDVAQTCNDDQLGKMSPMQTMMSALHETQYSRLFRS